LSGDEKAAPEIRKRAGSRWRYVLWSQRKVKACRLRQKPGDRIGCNRKSLPVEALKVHARLTAPPCPVLRQTSGALRQRPASSWPIRTSCRFLAVAHRVSPSIPQKKSSNVVNIDQQFSDLECQVD